MVNILAVGQTVLLLGLAVMATLPHVADMTNMKKELLITIWVVTGVMMFMFLMVLGTAAADKMGITFDSPLGPSSSVSRKGSPSGSPGIFNSVRSAMSSPSGSPSGSPSVGASTNPEIAKLY